MLAVVSYTIQPPDLLSRTDKKVCYSLVRGFLWRLSFAHVCLGKL